jgi:hypothetical protein
MAVGCVGIFHVTPKIEVVTLFGVTAGAAVFRHRFDGLRFQVIFHVHALLNDWLLSGCARQWGSP